jgi:hypothetical protein
MSQGCQCGLHRSHTESCSLLFVLALSRTNSFENTLSPITSSLGIATTKDAASVAEEFSGDSLVSTVEGDGCGVDIGSLIGCWYDGSDADGDDGGSV